jgi:hypothetical protein
MLGERGVGERVYHLWNERDMFPISQNGLMCQIRVIRRKNWFTLVELEDIQKVVKMKVHRRTQDQGDNHVVIDPSQNDIEQNNSEANEESAEEQALSHNVAVEDHENPQEQELPPELGDDEKDIMYRLTELIVCGVGDLEPQSLRYIDKKTLQEQTKKVDTVLKHINTDNITEMRDLIFCAAIVVGERVGAKRRTKKKSETPWWKRRIEEDIKTLRKHLSKIESWWRGKWKNARESEQRLLERKYRLKKKGFSVVVEEIKQRILSKAVKVRRYTERIAQFEQNRLFASNQKQFYRNLDGQAAECTPPNPEEATTYWSTLWGRPVSHNPEAGWLHRVKEQLAGTPLQEPVAITHVEIKSQTSGMPNWKAPGPDGIQGYWIKRFGSTHNNLAQHLNACLRKGEVPEWLVEGRTTLLMKDESKGPDVTNYRPIACLNLMWKLLTGIFANSIYTHLETNNLLPVEQKGCRKQSQGTKDHLAIDKTILKNCKRRKTNLCMAWIDFKKAYDMVPHSWIIEVLNIFNIAENVKQLLTQSMQSWRTTLVSNNQTLGKVEINRGIFQGDSLSPLLFVMALIPLTLVLRSADMGYKLEKDGPELNHLLFMDDLKIFAKTEDQVDSLVQTVQSCSSDIGMEMGISKCAVVTMHRGKKVACTGVELPSGERLTDPGEEGYKYLGVLELDDILKTEMKDKVRKIYHERLTKVLKSKLNSKNLACAINTWAVAVVRYSAALVDWTVEEIETLDRQTRQLLFEYKFLHPRANITRLYMKRKVGGRGLISIEDCVAGEKRSLDFYLASSEEVLLKYVARVNGLEKDNIEDKKAYQKRVENEKKEKVKAMPLHGQFERQTAAKKTADSWLWLSRGDLKRETESLLIAAQDQALATNSVKKSIHKTTDSDKCRLCGIKVESVTHIISACKMLAQREYKRRHDKVCTYVHWHLCNIKGFSAGDKWYTHRAEKVLEDEHTKLLWDFNVQTDRVIEHRRPDIILIDKESKVCFLIDVAVPGDHNVDFKEIEKLDNYSDLRTEIERMWNVKAHIIPVVIGALGSIPEKLTNFLDRLKIKYDIGTMQKTAILGSAHILRKVLSI